MKHVFSALTWETVDHEVDHEEKPSLKCRRRAEHGSSSENRRLVVAMLARHGKSNRAGRFERRSIEATENPEKCSALKDFFSTSQFYGMNLIHQLSKDTSREAPVQPAAATACYSNSKDFKRFSRRYLVL